MFRDHRVRSWKMTFLGIALIAIASAVSHTSSLAVHATELPEITPEQAEPAMGPGTEQSSAQTSKNKAKDAPGTAASGIKVPAPSVVVYGTDSVAPEASKLRLIGAEGKEFGSIPGMKKGEGIGGTHSIAVDQERERIYFGGADRLTAMDFQGSILWQVEKLSVNAFALDTKSGNLWCEEGWHLDKKKTIVISPDGKVVTEYPWGGVDIAYDPQLDVFWIAGRQIIRVDREGQMSLRRPLPDLPGIPDVPTVINARNWAAVSISPDLQHEVGAAKPGGAWVAIRRHPDVVGSRNRLARLDDQGETRMLVELGDVDPVAVACDAVGNCWVVDRDKGLLQFNIDGEQMKRLPIAAHAVAGDRKDGGAWVSTTDRVIRLDKAGKVTWIHKFGGNATQTWLGTSGF